MSPWKSGASGQGLPSGRAKRQRPLPRGGTRRSFWRSMDTDLHRRPTITGWSTGPPLTVVCRPLSWVRQNDVRLHDGVQFLDVARRGGAAVVGCLARVRVVGAQQRAVGACDLARGGIGCYVQGGVVVWLGVHCWFRVGCGGWEMAPGRSRGPSDREATSGAAFSSARQALWRGAKPAPIFRCCGRSEAPVLHSAEGHPRANPQRRGRIMR